MRYESLRVLGARVLRTRFDKWAGAWFSLRATRRASILDNIAYDFQPQLVLTVAHGFVWLAAAEFAKRHDLPLYLIVHDDWPRMGAVPATLSGWLDRRFGAVYRQAKVRFCVSPYMVDAYRQRYATEGHVLYPSRAADSPKFSKPPERLARAITDLTVGFAGSVNANYRQALKRIADALRPSGGKLVIFGPLTKADALQYGLNGENIEVRGLLPSPDTSGRTARSSRRPTAPHVICCSRSIQYGDIFSKQAHGLHKCRFAAANLRSRILLRGALGTRQSRSGRDRFN